MFVGGAIFLGVVVIVGLYTVALFCALFVCGRMVVVGDGVADAVFVDN